MYCDYIQLARKEIEQQQQRDAALKETALALLQQCKHSKLTVAEFYRVIDMLKTEMEYSVIIQGSQSQ